MTEIEAPRMPDLDNLRRLIIRLQGIPSSVGWSNLEINLFNEMIDELFPGELGEALHARLVKEIEKCTA